MDDVLPAVYLPENVRPVVSVDGHLVDDVHLAVCLRMDGVHPADGHPVDDARPVVCLRMDGAHPAVCLPVDDARPVDGLPVDDVRGSAVPSVRIHSQQVF